MNKQKNRLKVEEKNIIQSTQKRLIETLNKYKIYGILFFTLW